MSEREALFYLFSFILGTVIGSFLNVCIYRLPKGESLAFPSSHCTSCGKPIRAYHNIPIFGYLLLKGKCADCGSPIPLRYPAVELISGIALAGLYYKFGLSLDTLFFALLTYALIVITFIDLKYMIIPNVITVPGAVAGLLYGALATDWGRSTGLLGMFSFSLENFFGVLNEVPFLDSVFGLILGGGILFLIAFLYIAIRKQEGMGMGDVKLLAMIGAFLGWKGVVFVMLVSSLLGTLAGLSIILYKRGNLKYALPFGPFLSLAAVIYVFTDGFRLIN